MERRTILSIVFAAVLLSSITAAFLMNDPGTEDELLTDSPSADESTLVDSGPGPGAGTVTAVTQADAVDECEEEDVSALTTIAVCKEASGFWKRDVVYDWSVEKNILDESDAKVSSDGHSATTWIEPGESATIIYRITAERLVVEESETMGVSGYVRVTNTGLWPTENLKIMDKVQVFENGCCRDLVVCKVDTSSHPVLCPGESYDYAYEFEFDAIPGEEYCNIASVSITNTEFGPCPKLACDGFGIPIEPLISDIDEAASLIEEMTVPEGFEASIDNAGPWTLYDSGWVDLVVEVTNVEAPCDTVASMPNIARLVELDTCQESEDDTEVAINTPPCVDEATTIGVQKTADGTWTRGVEYDWTLEKTVSEGELTLATGEDATVTYTITVTRTATGVSDLIEVFGEVTVTNEGPVPTEDLAIHDTLYVTIESVETVLVEDDLDVSAMPVLGAGESSSYSYSFDITDELTDALGGDLLPDDLEGIGFRNVATASITNYDGHEGEAFGGDAEATTSFTVPELDEIDEQAALSDSYDALPDGITVTNIGSLQEIFNGDNLVGGVGTATWESKITNEDAECGVSLDVVNNADLEEQDTGTMHTDDATVTINTPKCEVDEGCTLTIGGWKARDGSGPHGDLITPLIQQTGGTIWLGTANGAKSVAVTTVGQATTILEIPDADNGIDKLYAQMLAAKLNILNGASDNAVEGTITDADAFLAAHNSVDWDGLTSEEQQQVLDWKTSFDNYNKGDIGPGHCE